MTSVAGNLERIADGQYRLNGAVTVANAARLQPEGLALMGAERSEITIDLSAMAPIDSAGLALLVDWIALVKSHGAQLRYLHLPSDARTLARVSEVEALLDPQAH